MQEILSKRNIGERIKILRVNNKHSQLFVADLLNLSRSNYSQIELGNQYPTFETLYTISRYYRKSYDWLLHGFEGSANGFTLPFNTIEEPWPVEGKYSTKLEPVIAELDVNVKKLEVTLNKIEKEISLLKTKLLKS